MGYDANNNSVMEATEVVPMTDSIKLFMAFGGDGSGTMTVNILGTDLSSNFNWELVNNNSDLHVKTQQASMFVPISDGYLHINTLTQSDLIIRDTSDVDSSGLASWSVFKKL